MSAEMASALAMPQAAGPSPWGLFPESVGTAVRPLLLRCRCHASANCAPGHPNAMSMKRSKQRSSGSGRYGKDDDSSAWGKPADPEPSWSEVESKPDDAFVPFALSSRYAKGDLILHPKFGKGLVLGVE